MLFSFFSISNLEFQTLIIKPKLFLSLVLFVCSLISIFLFISDMKKCSYVSCHVKTFFLPLALIFHLFLSRCFVPSNTASSDNLCILKTVHLLITDASLLVQFHFLNVKLISHWHHFYANKKACLSKWQVS